MKKYILLAAATFALAACSNDDVDNYADVPVEARITATIGQSAVSRAREEKWDEGDAIGITMGNLYINRKYTTEAADGVFSGVPMYFRNKQDRLNISAYYPYSGAEGSAPAIVETSTGIDRQTADEQPDFDFLYASVDNVSGAAPDVNFTFKHQMSKLTLIFKDGNGGTDVSKITSCRIDGLVLEGTFNPVTGECAAKNTQATPVEFEPAVVHNVGLPPFILFPQAVDKVTMKITDSEEQEYSCELKFTNNRLESGNHYIYTIVVKKTALNVEHYTITDWTETRLSSDGQSE
ncbi:MAG: fimbrillin family protein [Muribaculaceae bacterium]|nr:fimbrillin family protein [Muribaculaceae bacterium]